MADYYNANFIMCESFAIFVLVLFQNLITIHAFFFLRCSDSSKLDMQRHFEFVVYTRSCHPILILVYISRTQLFYINFELKFVKFLENDSLPNRTTWHKICQGLRSLLEM